MPLITADSAPARGGSSKTKSTMSRLLEPDRIQSVSVEVTMFPFGRFACCKFLRAKRVATEFASIPITFLKRLANGSVEQANAAIKIQRDFPADIVECKLKQFN